MKNERIAELLADFEAIARHEGGIEYWLARELQPLLGYERWENFTVLLERARTACAAAGQPVPDHFRDLTKMVALGSKAARSIEDVALTRYGAYLLAQNGDPRKEAIAFAQTYFAVQTRRQELIEARIEESERLRARQRLTSSEKSLSGVIFERLRDGESFARIRSKGDRALFGGISTHEMKERLDVPESRPLADFLPTITIKAKDFANEITIHNTTTNDLRSEGSIAGEHVKNNAEVRRALGRRGIAPEELPAAEDVRKVERRLTSDEKKLTGSARSRGRKRRAPSKHRGGR